jgi:hypothetical protein
MTRYDGRLSPAREPDVSKTPSTVSYRLRQHTWTEQGLGIEAANPEAVTAIRPALAEQCSAVQTKPVTP